MSITAVLAIYLETMLHYSENDATVIYHSFVMLCYFFPLFGAIIADCFLGRFKWVRFKKIKAIHLYNYLRS